MTGIEFPQPVCIDVEPHPSHLIIGSWRERCPGVPTRNPERNLRPMNSNVTPIVAVLGTERNTWMGSFAHASNRIAAAIVADDIEPGQVEAFPLGTYDEKACRTIAEAAGLTWGGDDDCDAWNATCCEDVEISIQAIRALPEASISSYEDTEQTVWILIHPETLEEFDTSIEELRAAVRGISLREAAALIVAADKWHHGKIRKG